MLVSRSSLLVSIFVVALIGCQSVSPTVESTPRPGQPSSEVATPSVGVPSQSKPAEAAPSLRKVSFSDVPGWHEEMLSESWPALMSSCSTLIKRKEWREVCEVALEVDAKNEAAVRLFFESFFEPHQVVNADATTTGLVTGYYEPLLRGARKRGGEFQTPLHREPAELLTIDMGALHPELRNMRLRGRLVGNKVVPFYSRAEMLQSGVLNGQELVWVDDPIEAFFLQVQGSGRVYLTDTKETVRLAYANQNGYPYRSIGRYLVDKGEMTLASASAQSIKAWYERNPSRREELLNANPSYVFFREERLSHPIPGPKGALGVPLTDGRSIAVDPRYVPLGAPVFLATTYPNSPQLLRRLVVAQDTGGAIKGAVRADFFWGFGKEAGELAGRMKQSGEMWALLPRPSE